MRLFKDAVSSEVMRWLLKRSVHHSRIQPSPPLLFSQSFCCCLRFCYFSLSFFFWCLSLRQTCASHDSEEFQDAVNEIHHRDRFNKLSHSSAPEARWLWLFVAKAHGLGARQAGAAPPRQAVGGVTVSPRRAGGRNGTAFSDSINLPLSRREFSCCRAIYIPSCNYVLTSGWCDSKWVQGTR